MIPLGLIHLLLGPSAHRIPPFEQFASLPGVDSTSARGIVRAMRSAAADLDAR
ncbi:MAG: hypothetical protein SF028_13130 [Candidatus Sumerlaeia bacterium]|nr:hypothetical protein [Candidatus Sumerlaeia bacterium]